MKALFVRLSSIGDVAHTLPSLAALRRKGFEIGWLVESPSATLLEKNPGVQRVHVLPRARSLSIGALRRMIAELRAEKYDVALDFQGLTCFGPVRVAAVGGLGGIFSQRFEVLDNQHGCIKWSAFSGDNDRLPANHFCVHAPDARVYFTSERFNDPGYAQLQRETDRRVRELGPDDDAMGAFGFLLEAHKWTNLHVRLGEFMPVGVRPLVVPVT